MKRNLLTLLIHMQVCLMALGHASPEHYPVLFEELPTLIDEYQKPSKLKKGTAKPEEVSLTSKRVMISVLLVNPSQTACDHILQYLPPSVASAEANNNAQTGWPLRTSS